MAVIFVSSDTAGTERLGGDIELNLLPDYESDVSVSKLTLLGARILSCLALYNI